MIIKIDNFLNKNLFKVSITLFLLSILFFQFNFLNISGSENFFDTPSMNMEPEVTDGIIFGEKNNKYILGRYDRTFHYKDIYPRDYIKFFKERISEGNFKKYHTSFGLQVKIYGLVNNIIKLNLNYLKLINVLILSTLILSLTIILKNHFSYAASFFFFITYIILPWNIAFANEIRLIQWTWLLPICVIFFFNISRDLNKYKNIIMMNLFIFLTLLFKLLVSYEFITTIIIFIIFVQLYFSVLNFNTFKKFFYETLPLFFVICFSVLIALFIHFFSFDNVNLHNQFLERFIYNFNFFNNSIEEIDCKKLVINNQLNHEYISHCVSRFEVVGRYFIFRNFIPFLGVFENFLSPDLKYSLVKIMLNKNYYKILSILPTLNLFTFLSILVIFLNILTFVLFLFFCMIFVILNKYDSLNIILIGGFLASVSWFFFAKTYSYVHFHLGYVNWTFVFIPFSSLVLVEKIFRFK